MAFVDKQDLISRILEEELDEIARGNDTLIAQHCEITDGIIAAHLNDWFEVEQMLSKTGAERDPLLLDIAIDITIYKLVASCQAGIDMTDRRMRYNEAMNMLEKACQPQDDKTSIYPNWIRREYTAENKISVVNKRPIRNNYRHGNYGEES